ncbi:hypothetical protein BDR26DRAFT_873462 [Obelidium mucronatum]|nr:hypothetical protein BDR26DRAFT_873462 [Obelidium mucronatum]
MSETESFVHITSTFQLVLSGGAFSLLVGFNIFLVYYGTRPYEFCGSKNLMLAFFYAHSWYSRNQTKSSKLAYSSTGGILEIIYILYSWARSYNVFRIESSPFVFRAIQWVVGLTVISCLLPTIAMALPSLDPKKSIFYSSVGFSISGVVFVLSVERDRESARRFLVLFFCFAGGYWVCFDWVDDGCYEGTTGFGQENVKSRGIKKRSNGIL